MIAALLLGALSILPPVLAQAAVQSTTPQPADFYGSVLLPKYRIVSYYGNPLSPTMGILGDGTANQVVQKLKAQAAAYAALDPQHPTIGALELVATVAQRSPGPNGAYSVRMPYGIVQRELDIARRNHLLLILDIQAGRASIPGEVRYFLPFLRQSDVELALDPEFAMRPGDIPGIEFGTMPTRDINWTLGYLEGIVRKYHLPQKILIVHQFIESMVPNWQGIVEQPDVALVRDMDGFGGVQIKRQKYEIFIHDEAVPYIEPSRILQQQPGTMNAALAGVAARHRVVCGGIKLFYKQDTPLMSPASVLTLNPPPLVVIYQ